MEERGSNKKGKEQEKEMEERGSNKKKRWKKGKVGEKTTTKNLSFYCCMFVSLFLFCCCYYLQL